MSKVFALETDTGASGCYFCLTVPFPSYPYFLIDDYGMLVEASSTPTDKLGFVLNLERIETDLIHGFDIVLNNSIPTVRRSLSTRPVSFAYHSTGNHCPARRSRRRHLPLSPRLAHPRREPQGLHRSNAPCE